MIRFLRTGKRNQPSFKIVVTEKQNASNRGRFLEEVGTYNPLTKLRSLNAERIKHWLSKGAKATDTVHNLLVKESVIEGAKIAVHKKSKKMALEATAPQTQIPAPPVTVPESPVVTEEQKEATAEVVEPTASVEKTESPEQQTEQPKQE